MFSLRTKVNFLYVAITTVMIAVALPLVALAAVFLVLPACTPMCGDIVKFVQRFDSFRTSIMRHYIMFATFRR